MFGLGGGVLVLGSQGLQRDREGEGLVVGSLPGPCAAGGGGGRGARVKAKTEEQLLKTPDADAYAALDAAAAPNFWQAMPLWQKLLLGGGTAAGGAYLLANRGGQPAADEVPMTYDPYGHQAANSLAFTGGYPY